MSKLPLSRLSPNGLSDDRAPAALLARRRLMVAVGAAVLVIVLVLAWFDGGEKAMRPIAEPVALPEQGQ